MNYMKKLFLPLLFITAVSTLTACYKNKGTNIYGDELTRGYYPLTKGHFVLYDVDSTIWNDFTGDSTMKHLQVRYDVADSFRDNQNRLSYQVEVRTRRVDTAVFRTNDVFFVTPTENGLDVIQNNLRFTKLIFPVTAGTTWKGNSQIATADPDLQYFADWYYTYYNIGASYNTGRVNFDNTVTVQQVDDSLNSPAQMPATYAERRFAKEVYGYNVGLIYREVVRWTYDQNPSSGRYARKGYGVVMRAVDHN
jgi:hypothetical protein